MSAVGAQLTVVYRVVAGGYLAVGSYTTATGANPRSPFLSESGTGRDWRLIGPPTHWGLTGADGDELVVFGAADFGTTALGVWITGDGRAWTRLAFAGDVAGAPAYETSVGQPAAWIESSSCPA